MTSHRANDTMPEMVSDTIENLGSYGVLSNGINGFSKSECPEVSEREGFSVNPNRTVIFIVDEGRFSAATTWRENPDSRECLAVMSVRKGRFVMFLPGEPYLIKDADGGGKISVIFSE